MQKKKHKLKVETHLVKLFLGNGTVFEKGKEPKIEEFDYVQSLDNNHNQIPLKYKKESVDEIQCFNVLQYLDGKQRLKYIDELWRIMKVGAKVSIVVPFWSSSSSISDPLYKWPPLSEASFLIFNKQWREQAGRTTYPVYCNFECPGNYGYNGIDNDMAGRHQEYVEQAVKHQLNTVQDLQVVLTKLE